MRLTALLLVFSSSVIADEPQARRGLAYAGTKNERQTLDVYAPTKGKNLPVVVWIHGGGWQTGDKKDVGQKPQAFADKGFVFVSVNYRLLPDVEIKQMVQDVAKAIRWVHDHAKDYRGDTSTIIVMGHSAGAQLAALVCTDERYLKAEGLPLSIIKACVPVDGDTYDIPMQIKMVAADRAAGYWVKFGDEKMQKELSPVTHIAKGKHIPAFLILHVANHPETRAQSDRLVKALQAAGVSARTYPAVGKNYNSINDDLGKADEGPTEEVFGFLANVLRKEPKFLGAKYHYPNIEKAQAGIAFPDMEAMRQVTKDDFEKVCKHYENIVVEMVHKLNEKGVRDAFRPGGQKGIVMIGPDNFVMNDSKDRPVRMLVFVHCGDDYQLTLVISQAKGELLTHIAGVFRANKKQK